MSSKREEERNEKIIRGLMKLPPNRRCINCNSMGPQYVCTNFWTFICMTCSGIHREFTHRVKSVSMAMFTSQEVDALQKGGNQRARELFMKSWDPQRQRLPDNSNIDKLRDFIKNVYVDRKYVMDKSSDKPPKDPQSLRNYEDGTRRASSYHSYSQSPPYDFQYEERRYGKHAPVLSRKPGSDRGMYDGKLASFLSPSRFSDHVTDDRFANEGSCPRFSNYSVSAVSDPFRSDIMSPSSQRDVGSPLSDTSRDFYGEVPQDRVVLPSPDLNRTSDGARVLQPQRTVSSGSFGSHDSNSMSFKSVNSLGMADMGSEPQKSTRIPLEKSSSLPVLPQSSAAATFGGLDLFDASFGTQSFASSAPIGSDSQVPQSSLAQSVDLFQQAPTSSVSMFTESQPSQLPQSSSLELNTMQSKQQLVSLSAEKTSDVVTTPINGGWATFDMPQNFAPLGTENSAPVAETFNPFSHDQKSSYRDFSGHSSFAAANTLWHESLQNVEPKKNNDQVWNAFENLHTVQSVLQTNEESLPNIFSDGDKFFGFGVDKVVLGSVIEPRRAIEALKNGSKLTSDSNVGAPVDSEPPVPILSSNYSVGLSHFPVVPALADPHLLATDRKPTNNPFDLPDDDATNMEPGNMFWDMNSLQDALPNPQEQASSSYVGGFDQSWLTQNPVPSFVSSAVSFDPPNGSLEFIAGQAPKPPQILAQQGPVASVGGNPFA